MAASGSHCPKRDEECYTGWVLVRGFNLSYHNKETILSTIDPYYCSLNKLPYQEPSRLK